MGDLGGDIWSYTITMRGSLLAILGASKKVAAAQFNPVTELETDLLALWDGEDEALPADDAEVLSWADQSGNGHTVTFAEGLRPTMQTVAGKRLLRSGGASSGIVDLTADISAVSADYYIVTVFKHSGAIPESQALYVWDSSTPRTICCSPTNVSPFGKIGNFYNGAPFMDHIDLDANIHVMEMDFVDPLLTTYVDGVEQATTKAYTAAAWGTGTMRLMSVNTSDSAPFNGDLYYLGIAKNLTAQQRADWYDMISSRYL